RVVLRRCSRRPGAVLRWCGLLAAQPAAAAVPLLGLVRRPRRRLLPTLQRPPELPGQLVRSAVRRRGGGAAAAAAAITPSPLAMAALAGLPALRGGPGGLAADLPAVVPRPAPELPQLPAAVRNRVAAVAGRGGGGVPAAPTGDAQQDRGRGQSLRPGRPARRVRQAGRSASRLQPAPRLLVLRVSSGIGGQRLARRRTGPVGGVLPQCGAAR